LKQIILCILIFTVTGFSQTSNSESGELKIQKALLFSINGLELDTFDGGIGFKTTIQENYSLIVKIQYMYAKHETDKTERLTGNTDKDLKYGGLLGFQKRLNTLKNITPYVGSMIGGAYEEKTSTVNSADYIGAIYTNKTLTSLYSVSIHIFLGVEFFLTESISLSGQYNIGGIYSFGKEDYETLYSKSTMDVSDIRGGITSGELILSIYF